jgi:hypothetical protein
MKCDSMLDWGGCYGTYSTSRNTKPGVLFYFLSVFITTATAASFAKLPSPAPTRLEIGLKREAVEGNEGVKIERTKVERQVVSPPTATDRTAACDPCTEEVCLNAYPKGASSSSFGKRKVKALWISATAMGATGLAVSWGL